MTISRIVAIKLGGQLQHTALANIGHRPSPRRARTSMIQVVEHDALATLVVNKLRGVLACAAVKSPGYGDRRKALMEDLAIVTGGQFIAEELGVKLEAVTLKDMGHAQRVIVEKDATTIISIMMRTLLGIRFRNSEIITFDPETTIMTASPITREGFNCAVTAKTEQIPSTWIVIGLLSLNGSDKARLFFFENSGSFWVFPAI